MTNQELQQWVEEVSLRDFHRPFCHQAVFNQRLKTTGGRYHLTDHHLDFNPQMLSLGAATFEKIILHELCHYHLHLQGQPHNHRDTAFKELLAKVGGLRYAPSLSEAAPKKYFIYQCQACGGLVKRRRQVDVTRFVCGRCRQPLQFKGVEWL